jgi:hypothetical protein
MDMARTQRNHYWIMAASTFALACGGGGSSGSGEGDSSGGSLTAADATGSADGTGVGTVASDDQGGASTTSASPDDGAENTIFDVHASVDIGVGQCRGGGKGGGGQTPEFSFIWVANAGQGTISKINTQTMVEEGRYRVRADSAGSPSRTSVNLSGDVAVANRNGGVTKVYANAEACQESNGMGGLQTSTGAADILAWGDEECVAWYTPFAYTTQRPVAWAPAPFDETTCSYPDQKLWTSGATNTITVHLLDGETGTVEQTIPIPELSVGSFGAYGGAVNGDGDFWITTYDQPPQLVRVDRNSFDYEIVQGPDIHSYGMTVDSKGRPWIGGFINGSARYSPDTDTWDVLDGVLGYGIQEDADGLMWLATFSPEGVRSFDSDTLALGSSLNLPGSGCKGVSIDF